MKKTIFLLLLSAFSLTTYAQKIDTTCKCGPSIRVQPFKVHYLDSTKAEWLQAYIVHDNLISEGEFKYRLLDSNCNQLGDGGNVTISGQEYKDWSGINIDSYKYVAEKIKVTLYKD